MPGLELWCTSRKDDGGVRLLSTDTFDWKSGPVGAARKTSKPKHSSVSCSHGSGGVL
jgi:hypothetical protein